MSRQTQLEVEMNSVVTKTTIVLKEFEKNYNKNVVTQKLMSRHNKEMKVEIFVATKEDYITIIKVVE